MGYSTDFISVKGLVASLVESICAPLRRCKGLFGFGVLLSLSRQLQAATSLDTIIIDRGVDEPIRISMVPFASA